MVESISSQIAASTNFPIIGRQLLEVVTSGMYNDPLMTVREYIQNSADAIDSYKRLSNSNEYTGKIDITTDAVNRELSIVDNGTGVNNDQVMSVLCSIGASNKDLSTVRGFRGIGRFGGLGYCESLIFETRAHSSEQIATITWDAKRLAEYLNERGSLCIGTLVHRAVSCKFRAATTSDSAHFFSVKMSGIRRFRSDLLLSRQHLVSYLSQVAPVSYNHMNFIHAKEIEDHVRTIDGFRQYEIRLDDEAVFRPYASKSAPSSFNQPGEIKDISLFEFLDQDDNILARGWFAVNDLCATLPHGFPMRGLSVRQGNIEIGNETLLADFFTERRFAGWQIGEIHTSSRLRPNARRDSFEQTRSYESFLEQAELLCRHLSLLCKKSSGERTRIVRREKQLSDVEQSLKSHPFFVDKNHFEYIAQSLTSKLDDIEDSVADLGLESATLARVDRCRRHLRKSMASPVYLSDCLDGRRLKSISQKDLLVNICSKMAMEPTLVDSGSAFVSDCVAPYLKQGVAKS